MSGQFDESILLSLRRITRAIDLHSRSLALRCQLTAPQLVCLRHLVEEGSGTSGGLARKVSLSQATVTGILDRLEARGLVGRQRDGSDRRRVIVTPTPAGQALAAQAPMPLQERFAGKLAGLPLKEQARLDQALRQIVEMMEVEDLPVAPVLAAGHQALGPEEARELALAKPRPAGRR
ncbi:MAG: MarR family transcriptional regulator [Pseudomonadota bacterium]